MLSLNVQALEFISIIRFKTSLFYGHFNNQIKKTYICLQCYSSRTLSLTDVCPFFVFQQNSLEFGAEGDMVNIIHHDPH